MQHLAPQVWPPLLIDRAECLRWEEEPEVDARQVLSGPSKDHLCVTILKARQLIRADYRESRPSREPSVAQFLEVSEKLSKYKAYL